MNGYVSEYMSTKVLPYELSYDQLVHVCSDEFVKATYQNDCANELAVRCLIGKTPKSASAEIIRFMSKWDGQCKRTAMIMMTVIDNSIARCESKKLSDRLNYAKQQLEEVTLS